MKESNFKRSTEEIRFENLHLKFIRYFRQYIELHQLGDIEKEVERCFVTTNLKKGFLGKMTTDYTVICITKQFLFWGIIKDKKETGIAAAKWNEITEIHDWETLPHGKIRPDHGLELHGFIYQASRRSFWFIGLGNDEAGNACRKYLKELLLGIV